MIPLMDHHPHRRRPDHRAGISLILVMTLLAGLLLLASYITRALWQARLGARHDADRAQARELARAAVGRAQLAVNDAMRGGVYPFFAPATPDVLTSSTPNGSACDRLDTALSRAQIPAALWPQWQAAADEAQWIAVHTPGDSQRVGRVAWAVVNVSGLLDANRIGGTNRLWSAHPAEVALSALAGIQNHAAFLAARAADQPYVTVAELTNLNAGVAVPCELWVPWSFDAGRDVRFATNAGNPALLGTPAVALAPKCPLDATPDSTNLLAHLEQAGYAPALAGVLLTNLLDYLDGDRLPLSDHSVEAVPLINEIVVRPFDTGDPARPHHYALELEVWFPFRPGVVSGGQYRVEIAVGTNTPPTGVSWIWALPALDTEQAFATGAWTQAEQLIAFPEVTTNLPPQTNYLPMGALNGAGGINTLWLQARIVETAADLTVDAAPEQTQATPLTNSVYLAVDDPRLNGELAAWTRLAPEQATPGGLNTNSLTAGVGGSDQPPLFHRDGVPANIGELGYLFTNAPWRSVDLATPEGGALLDLFTVRAANAPTNGLVHAQTAQTNALAALLVDLPLPFGGAASNAPVVTEGQAMTFVDLLGARAGMNWSTLLGDLGANPAYRDWTGLTGDKEDLIRGLAELLSFRQNLLLVFAVAETLAPDGVTVTARQRVRALLIRDAYTGRVTIQDLLFPTE